VYSKFTLNSSKNYPTNTKNVYDLIIFAMHHHLISYFNKDFFCLFYSVEGHGMDLPKAYAGCDANHAAILVAHQPKAAKFALDSDYSIQLVLSGML